MNASGTPYPQPLVGRQRLLIRVLKLGVAVAVVLATIGLILPGDTGRLASEAFLGVLIAAPLVRVTWLTVRWIHRRDLRFALVGVGLLLVVATAVATAW